MRFAAIALATGLVGTLFAANVQGNALPADAASARLQHLSPEDVDFVETGSIGRPGAVAQSDAIRLIDLRSGQTCKTENALPASATFTDAPLGRDCKTSPSLARIAFWRARADGTLVMADSGGGTIMEFAPGDGVLYESIFPLDALITIVPARS